jgi:carbamoyltransferase
MTAILGLSAFYHDSAAALVVDGELVAAAQEERFTRKKHDYAFPTHAIAYCLEEAGITAEKLDYVGFYDKPLLKFDRLIETYMMYAPQGFKSFMRGMPLWLKQKLHLPREIKKGLGGKYKKRCIFTLHHESHAASAFFPSPYEDAAILTLDGVGEWSTATFGVGNGNKISLSHELRFPHSLGLLYSALTYYCGFKVNSGEYKLMGLAPYGEPEFEELMLKHLIDLKEDGSFRMDMQYFNYCQGLTMTSKRFDKLFGGPPRKPETPISEREMNLAASVQKITEKVMLKMARHVHAVTKKNNLCLAGGVALNCVGNGVLARQGPFEDIWIQPASGDAGGALGTALFIWHQLLDNKRSERTTDVQKGSLLGPRFDREKIVNFLDKGACVYDWVDDEDELCQKVAALIASGNVIGWMQGRMEFGPRALGSRSILGDPRSAEMQSKMNLKIKFRESFRPFAPSVLREHAPKYFDMSDKLESPYMLLVADVAGEQRQPSSGERRKGLDRLKDIRSNVPAITHVDYSARVQTVDAKRYPRYHKLLQAFFQQTGCPMVINTSFNVRGEPIVCSPENAYFCFMATNMDVLVLENAILYKDKQPDFKRHQVDDYLAQFELD